MKSFDIFTFCSELFGATHAQVFSVIRWNEERNGLKYNSTLEATMLREEIEEFLEAETLVDRIDAFLDTVFVLIGTRAKLEKTILDSSFDLETYNQIEQVVSSFYYMKNYCLAEFKAGGGSEWSIEVAGRSHDILLMDAFDYVIEANELKGTERDENGKIIKGDAWVDPKIKIATFLERRGYKAQAVN